MSNLTDLLPAGAGGKQVSFTADGAITSGKPVILNAAGTVTEVGETTYTQQVGSETLFNSDGNGVTPAIVGVGSSKVAIAYKDSGSDIKCVIGTISGTTITFGTPVTVFSTTETTEDPTVAYDSANDKIVVAFSAKNTEDGYSYVGTISGNSVSFGSVVIFESGNVRYTSAVYDSANEKIVISYKDLADSRGHSIVGTVSGTSISYGTAVEFETGTTNYINSVYDPDSQKVFITYRDDSNSNYGTGVVGTVSGTSISFGTPVVFYSGVLGSYGAPITYDASAQKVVFTYTASSDSNEERIQAGTITGTSVSYGTAQVATAVNSAYLAAAYNPISQSNLMVYRNSSDSGYGYGREATLSGTTFTFGTQFLINNTNGNNVCNVAYIPGSAALLYANYVEGVEDDEATVIILAGTESNLTATNFIGISDAAISDTASGSVTIKGGISTNVTGLTPNQTYYVQADGTLSTTTSTVLAGKALSSTSINLDYTT